MPHIQCDAMNCAYNREACCVKNDVFIDGSGRTARAEGTSCISFEESAAVNSVTNAALPSSAGDAYVDCAATNCLYNDACECTAARICVCGRDAGCPSETYCDSFTDRNRR